MAFAPFGVKEVAQLARLLTVVWLLGYMVHKAAVYLFPMAFSRMRLKGVWEQVLSIKNPRCFI